MPMMPAQARVLPWRPLALIAAMPVTNSVSPSDFSPSGPAARYISPHCTKIVPRMSWPLPVSASSSGSRYEPSARCHRW